MTKFINRLDPIIPSMLSGVGYFFWQADCYLAAFFVMVAVVGLFAIQIYLIGWYIVDIARMLRADARREQEWNKVIRRY